MKELLKKLLEAKKEIGAISKDSTNPFYKSSYFDINQLLEHVEPILAGKGLLLLQPITDGKVQTIIIDVENDVRILSEIELSGNKDPQKLGSEISYYRRYTLTSLLAIQAEDDDGNKASKVAPKKIELTNSKATAEIERGWTIERIKQFYIVSPEQEKKLIELIKNKK